MSTAPTTASAFLNIPVPNTAKSQLESSARHSTVSMKMWYCPLFPKCSKLFLILRSWTKQDPIQLSDNLLNVTWLKSVLAYIGFPQAGFSSTDYFPLLPWIFLFATGYFLYSFLQEKGLINRLFGKWKVPGINFLGKHSLIIYMIHQPICYVVAFLVSEIF